MGKPLSGRAPRPRAEGGNEKRKFCMFHLQGICRKSTQECPWAHSIEEMESSRSRAKKKASPARDDSASWPSESSSSPAPPLREAVQAATAAQKHCRPPQTSTAPALAATHVMDGGVDMIAGSTRRGDPRLLNLSPEPVLTPERGMYYTHRAPPGAQGAAPVPLPELPLDWPAGGLSPQGPPDEPTAPKHPSEPPPSALGAGLLRLGVGWPGPPPGLEDADVHFPGFQPSHLSALVPMPAMALATGTGPRCAPKEGAGLGAAEHEGGPPRPGAARRGPARRSLEA